MTTEETRQAAEVMLAFAEGKKIELRSHNMGGKWIPATPEPTWSWHTVEYRVVTEPWAAKIWVHSNGGCLPYRDREPEDLWANAGWRLITVKEVLE